MLVATAISPEEITYAWLGPIVKTEKDGDARYVYGKATDGSIDSDEQIVDPVFAKKALADWYATGANIRQMHSTNLPPAGKGVMLESLADGEYVKAKVVEPVAVKLVDEDVYQGYSVGISRPRIVRDNKARGGRIVGGKIVELSLVDRPANTMAKFAVLKMARGSLEFVGKVVVLDAPAETVRPARRPITRYQKGAHVTVHARSPYGDVLAYEGRVLDRSVNGLALDQAGFSADGVVHFTADDIVAVYKGSVTVQTRSAEQEGVGLADPSVVNKADDAALKTDFFTEGGVVVPIRDSPGYDDGVHGQSQRADDSGSMHQARDKAAGTPTGTEDLMADQTSDSVTATKAADGADCAKCGGSGQFESNKCDKCDGTGKAEIVKDGGDLMVDDVAKGKKGNPFAKKPAADEPAEGTPAEEAAETPAEEATEPVEKTKGVRVEPQPGGTGYQVVKGEQIIGTHLELAAAEAQREAFVRDRKAAKVAKKAAKAARLTGPIVTKAATDDSDTIPWLLRRAHDFSCGAYKTEDVIEAYPSIESGAALTKGTRAALYAGLTDEVQKNAGGNQGVEAIEGIGKSLRALTDLLDAEAPSDVLVASRDELHEVFKAANGFTDAEPGGIPKPSESISAGQFKRGYLSAGHQAEHASAHAAHIPTTTHPVSADDFKRGPITEGHQRYLTGKLEAFHDGLTEWHPDLCLMSAMDSDGSFASQRQPSTPIVAQVPNGQANGPTTTNGNASSAKVSTFVVSPVDGGPVVKQLTVEDIRAAVSDALEPHLENLNKIASLEETVEAMASAPDTSRSALRGVAGTGGRSLEKVSTADKVKRETSRGPKAEKVEYMQAMARSTDAGQRSDALDWLSRKGIEIEG